MQKDALVSSSLDNSQQTPQKQEFEGLQPPTTKHPRWGPDRSLRGCFRMQFLNNSLGQARFYRPIQIYLAT